ncbi:YfcE family phosphodiesterase [bacterium]|nr:MAG: YfcE family phosphodiesterase [bacterium]
MRVAILSDTHDRLDRIRKAMELIRRMKIKVGIHLGDFVSPFVVKELDFEKLYGVFGNNDGDKDMLRKKFQEKGWDVDKGPRVIELENRKILLMHEPHMLDAFVESGMFRIILYGHTHRLEVKKGKPMIINPGELAGWTSKRSSFVVLELSNLEYEVIYL